MEIFNKDHLKSPHWSGRNRLIAERFLTPNKTIIDLGCGEKDLLKYYSPKKYLGVDVIDTADLILDLNQNFSFLTKWDYAINSGILEYLDNFEKYFLNLKGLATEYIFTWWSGTGYGLLPHDKFETILSQYFLIDETANWGTVQKIYKCYESE